MPWHCLCRTHHRHHVWYNTTYTMKTFSLSLLWMPKMPWPGLCRTHHHHHVWYIIIMIIYSHSHCLVPMPPHQHHPHIQLFQDQDLAKVNITIFILVNTIIILVKVTFTIISKVNPRQCHRSFSTKSLQRPAFTKSFWKRTSNRSKAAAA